MKIPSKLNTSNLSANEEALRRCEAALTLKDKSDYEGARDVMGHLWKGLGVRPDTQGLHPSVAAEVLLCMGILTGWVGSKNDVKGAQELAKNLITESITYFESIGDVMKIAAARVELACCYWRQGELNESRIVLTEALEKLTAGGNTRARALILLSTVEWTASRYDVALSILTENASLFNKVTNHTTKGNYHNELAIVLRHLAGSGNRAECLRRAIVEFEKADDQFKSARNSTFRASVKNNVGLILFNLSRFREAHQYLEQARSLTLRLRDKLRTAQIDETRAQVFIAEKKLKQAEAVARNAVRVLEKSGQQCLLADALITQGIALARLKRSDPAQFIFQKAIEVAHQVGALNKAGLAALTMIEELNDLSADTLYVAYDRASEWLAKSQSQDILLRVNGAARKVIAKSRTEFGAEEAPTEDPIEALFNKPVDLQSEVLKFEGRVIQRALAKANGSLTRAAASLSMSYQALAYILESRQKDLLKERTPIRRRSRRESAPLQNAEQS
ncbi:MAG: helix-turn-helix domain-containing protein [Pyrinomonadaceae bacterium]